MSKATFWQRGETLDYKNTTAAVIEENTIIEIGTRIGITGTYINPNEVGSLHVVGVFEMPKVAAEAITMGAAVYFDGSAITTVATDNTPAGYAAASAEAADTTVLVKLLG
jgi:predicted RecA/RadA family phage recombinase